ncbi:patatin-like phospholipase family protein [Brevundimonas pishanensis]|uniref:patatin-like phospholipase family protein n=1 Tax=Brevundimonas pishanensis TaxID=2896315 RepID=UPI001FA75934|nr:patatin-like phospholipase family protein [Brevundimonas pishanensis]
MRSLLRPLATLALTASLAACGTLDRPDGPLRLNDPKAGVTPAQAQASVDARVTDFLNEFGNLMADRNETNLLALSGGGANGAYGGGLLVGWSDSGTRPVFDVVTGVSTGALAAPFAFLGSEWDDKLREAYTSGQSDNLIGARSFAAVFNPSLFSSRRLQDLVDSYVSFELMSAVAREHAKGRRLLVVTTNLDTQESVIWDMGEIARRGDEEARELFKKVLVASASIPGVFPPVLLPGLSDQGQVMMEMHVDGGVNLPYLAVPEGLMLWTSPRQEGIRAGAMYVVVNGQTGRNIGTTPGRLTGILGRTYDSMSKASLRTHLAVTAGFARRNGLEFSFTAIPDNVQASALAFDQASMTALFELARQRGRDGSAWRRLDEDDPSKDFVPADEVSEQDIPEELKVEEQPANDNNATGEGPAETPTPKAADNG